jgi:four helix bundle protein
MRQPIHERLDAYEVSRKLAVELYPVTAKFPAEERYGLASQIRRAAVSIPANIAEGAARRSKKEFVRFLLTSRGSATELRLLLDIAYQTGSLRSDRLEPLLQTVDRIIAMTSGLINRSDRVSDSRFPIPDSRP